MSESYRRLDLERGFNIQAGTLPEDISHVENIAVFLFDMSEI